MNCQFWPEISTCLNEFEDEKYQLFKGTLNLDTITKSREYINNQLERLQLSLEQSLEKNHASLILFAIVAYIDEQMQAQILKQKQGNWVPLQKDFYGAYNAGDLFYETVDKLIDDPKTPSIVLNVFYFILKRGFLGRYSDSKTHINKYLDFLKDKIPVTSAHMNKEGKSSFSSPSKKVRLKKWHYYAGAGCVSLLFIIILYITSSLG